MESGTYDAAAKQIAQEFQKEHGVEVKIVAFPWAVLRQNNTTDLITGAGQYQVMRAATTSPTSTRTSRR